ncbi:MAG: glycosyltransferase [Verrucomicrobia bacterium]|nr:glycosyltransferase [Verrucomicrobiota bacterium]
MKILIVQDHLRSGGTERQSILLARAFASAGHRSTLLTFRPGGALADPLPPEIGRIVLQPFDCGLDWFAPGLVAAVHRAAPDVILCMGRMANCHGWRLHRLAPTVATMRTGKSLPWLFRRTLRSAAHIVANSRDARDTLVGCFGFPAQKISVIYNSLVFAAAGSAPFPSRAALRSEHGASPGTRVLLCVAMFRPEKNQRELLEIVAGLPEQLDWQLWLAGDGPARPACELRCAALGLGARVKFLGFQRDPTPLYRAADLAVHASASEALSNFLIEAQAHGVLAVAYQAQGIHECFVPGRTGWAIPRGDRNAFRATLSRRLSEPQIAHDERAADARAFARNTFDPARQVEAYLELFPRLSSHPAP